MNDPDVYQFEQLEKALRESEERYRQLVEFSPIGIFLQCAGNFVFVNRALAGLLGSHDPESFIGKPVLPFIHPDYQEVVRERMRQIRDEGKTVPILEEAWFRLDGTSIDVEVAACPFTYEGKPAAQVMVRDITLHKRAEKLLLQERHLLHSLMDNMPDTIYFKDREGRFIRVNKAKASRIGLNDPAQAVGKSDFDFYTSAFSQQALHDEQEVMTSGRPMAGKEEKIQLPDGQEIWVSATKVPLFDPDRNIIGTFGISRDITERKKAEAALRQNQQELAEFFENAPVGLCWIGPDGRILRANQAALELVGHGREEFVGRHIADFHADAEVIGDILQNLARGNTVNSCEARVRCKNGSIKHVIINANALIQDGRFIHSRFFFRDVTERKQAEEDRRKFEAKIQHAQKLESLGVLAGGIAHDFNNLLTGILGNASLALLDLPPGSPGYHSIKEMETAALRAADLTKQMLAYSGKGRFVVQRLNLSRIVEEMAGLLRTIISKKAVLRFDFAPTLPAVEADPTQLRQIVMNLITNASDAIGDRSGFITIRTGILRAEQSYLNSMYVSEQLEEGYYSYVEVADTGCGMEDGTLQKMFDPFFTTKFTGRGLGLAAVLGIVRGHRGAIKVYSEPGRGTTFKVLFPCTEHAEIPSSEATQVRNHWRGAGSVLVVDDEETVRTLARRALERSGFDVVLAADGREGLEAFRQRGQSIVAVILDLTMPQMNGEEVFREIRLLQPGVRVVLMSGYNEQEVISNFAGKGLAGFVQKPFRVEDFLATVRRVLEDKR